MDVGGTDAPDQIFDVIDAWGGAQIREIVGGADDADGFSRLRQSIASELVDLGERVGGASRIGAHTQQAGSGLERDARQIVTDDVMHVAG